jgi:hypothetical protein
MHLDMVRKIDEGTWDSDEEYASGYDAMESSDERRGVFEHIMNPVVKVYCRCVLSYLLACRCNFMLCRL